MMSVLARWLRLILSYAIFAIFIFCACYWQSSVYILNQARGQLSVLFGRESPEIFQQRHALNARQKENLALIEVIKHYSVDSLGYLPSNSYREIYAQSGPVLWAITASEPYALKAYQWKFPLVGSVSYKGFFRKDLAEKEETRLRAQGYDVDLRPVSAWSTLGWFDDPVLSSMLNRSKGSLCTLLFHELFHATYYAPSSVNFNENIASFVAHKATLRFLQNDSASLREYLHAQHDNLVFKRYMQRKNKWLKERYAEIGADPQRFVLKLRYIWQIADSVPLLPLKDAVKIQLRKKEILSRKNAYFIDFEQYESLQDSLEEAFNKFYRGDIKKMVQDLKAQSNYY